MKASQVAERDSAIGKQGSSGTLINRALVSVHKALISAAKIPLQDHHALEVSYSMKQRLPHIELRFLTPKGQQVVSPLLEIAQNGSRTITLRLTQDQPEDEIEFKLLISAESDLSNLATQFKKILRNFLVQASAMSKSKKYQLCEKSLIAPATNTAQRQEEQATSRLASLNLFDEELFNEDNVISSVENVAPLSIEGLM